jgi:tRNA dimethylallyltransferase
MWAEDGLLDEVRALLPQGLADGQTASRAIGYAQAIAVLGGRMSVEEGVAETIRLTWRVVRRQRAWFARDEGATTIGGDDADRTQRALEALVHAPL